MVHKILKYFSSIRTALGLTQPHMQWVPGALSVGVKRPGREADHSLTFTFINKKVTTWNTIVSKS
jgi:hypothetical protein